MSVGDLIGGLVYGAIRWLATRSRQLVVSLVLTAVAAWVAVPASGAVAVLFLTLLVSGVLGASVGICMSALLDDVTSPQSLTSAYTSMVSLGLVASAAGNASAGAVAERVGPAAGFGLTCPPVGSGLVLSDVHVGHRQDAWLTAGIRSGACLVSLPRGTRRPIGCGLDPARPVGGAGL